MGPRVSLYSSSPNRAGSAASPAINQLTQADVPTQWDTHPLITGQIFYSLPPKLLDAIWPPVMESTKRVKDIALERALGHANADHSGRIGFVCGRSIAFSFLCERPLDPMAREYIASTGAASVNAVEEAINWGRRQLRAFAGWLMTNRSFLSEHAAVWEAIRPLVTREGCVPTPILAGTGQALETSAESASETTSGVAALAALCGRWRLSRLAGPLLPEPLGVQMPAPLPHLSAQHAMASGYGIVAVPDVMPLPAEKDLRQAMASAIEAPTADHLREWKSIIANQSTAKRETERYARVFELQHFYRVVMSRHADALDRKRSHLEESFAAYFEKDPTTIRRDLKLIRDRLGKNWWAEFPFPQL